MNTLDRYKNKLSRSEFDQKYWGSADPVPEATRREFYSDYINCHTGSFENYVALTTTRQPMKKRFAITHEHADGTDRLVHANQGRFHFDSFEEAEKHQKALEPGLKKFGLKGIRVREIECYDHGDAVSTVFPRYIVQ